MLCLRCRSLLFGSFQEAIQAGAAYSEQLSGADAIAIAGFEDAPDVLAANFI